MKKISLYLSLSLIAISMMAGIAIGYSFTPDYRAMSTTMTGLGTPDYFLDRRYIDSMISHHEAAIALAKQAEANGSHEEIKNLAKAIQNDEPQLINRLYGYKRDIYRDRRPAPSPKFQDLGPAGDTFDLRFLNALIAHHEEGIAMAKEVKQKSSRAEIIDDADAVTQALTASLERLRAWRLDWYKI
ncbi:MAG: DUF305 domain-containing protein [Bacillota bacterium]